MLVKEFVKIANSLLLKVKILISLTSRYTFLRGTYLIVLIAGWLSAARSTRRESIVISDVLRRTGFIDLLIY